MANKRLLKCKNLSCITFRPLKFAVHAGIFGEMQIYLIILFYKIKNAYNFPILFLHLTCYKNEWQQRECQNNFKIQNNPPEAGWQEMQIYYTSEVIDIFSKWCDRARVFLTKPCFLHSCSCLSSLLAVSEREELRWALGQMINTLCSNVWFHCLTVFVFFFSFGFNHISISSLPVYLFISVIFTFPCSAFIFFLSVLSLLPPLPFALSLILTFLFCFFLPGSGLRPAVAVCFEVFQVFSQQQEEIVMTGCVHTHSLAMSSAACI